MTRTFILLLLQWTLHSYTAFSQCNLKKPKNLAVNAVTSCSASLSWMPVTGAAYYQVRYKLGAGSWNYINTGINTSWEVTGLLANKNYSFSVASFCANDSTKGYATKVAKKTLSCSAPEAIVVTGINEHKATIQWQPVCGGTLFNLQYRALGATTWATISNIAATAFQITGLAMGTSYEFQIQTKCGSGSSNFTPIQLFTTNGSLPDNRPNILAIMVDDGRYDIYQPNGGPSWFETPAISRIASEGVNFKITCPATSLCAPSRATFYTGLYPHNHGCITNGDHMNDSLPLIQQILKDNGYFTGFVGKYGQNLGNPVGFNWWATSKKEQYVDVEYVINGTKTLIPGHISDIYPQLALEFLNLVPEGQPFVLFYFHRAPHEPIVPRAQDAILYLSDTIPFPSNFYEYDHDYGSFYYDSNSAYKWIYDTIETSANRLLEYQAIAGVEDNTDTLLDWLELKNVMDNTLVMYTSDNGYLRGEHLLQGKGLVQEESMRIPLFIRYPKWFTPGTIITNEIASNIDFAPTFLDLAGIPDTFGMNGLSLYKIANQAESRKEFLYEYGGSETVALPLRAIRSLPYKYIRYYCDEATEEFFDLVNDPAENNNLIGSPDFSTLIARYSSKLDSLRLLFADFEPSPVECHPINPTLGKILFNNEQDSDPNSATLIIIPNPAGQLFTIQCRSNRIEQGDITVTNTLGEPVLMKFLTDSRSPFTINCALWPEGIYTIGFKTKDTTISEKIMVMH